MFLNGTVEYKRFILQTVISNSSYYDGKLDVELHPVFDTLFRLSRIHEQMGFIWDIWIVINSPVLPKLFDF